MQSYKPYKDVPPLRWRRVGRAARLQPGPRTRLRERRVGDRRGARPGPAQQAPISAEMRLRGEQMMLNEALVAKVFEAKKTELALRSTARKLDDMRAQQRAMRESHDKLGECVRALRTDIAVLRTPDPGLHARIYSRVAATLQQLDGALESIRQIGVAPPPVQLGVGLGAAVELEFGRFKLASRLECNLAVEPRIRAMALPDELAVTVYRAFQECLSNVILHSAATRVNVLVEVFNGTVLLNVSDNGIGFDANAYADAGDGGLSSVAQRLAAMRGKLVVASSPSHGTAVTLSVPAP